MLIELLSMLNVFELSPFPAWKKAAQSMEKESVIYKQIECYEVIHNDSAGYYVRGFWVWYNFPTFATCNNH